MKQSPYLCAKKNWRKIKQRILLRKLPHAVLSWRYMLFNQPKQVKLHKAVFRQAWSQFPRPVWWLIAIYSYGLWYAWHGWRSVFKVWKNKHPTVSKKILKTETQQLLDLLRLAYGHSIPPFFYYRYQLYRYPEKNWLNFIYTHELPHWHTTQSPNITSAEKSLISNKHLFAKRMLAIGVPSIPTLAYLDKKEHLENNILWQQKPLFIKPVNGSQKQGCYQLDYNKNNKNYRLAGKQTIANKAKIIEFLHKEIEQYPILVQPLLNNHPSLQANTSKHQPLIIIRLVTAQNKKGVQALCASLELPIDFQYIHPLPICLKKGTIQPAISHLKSIRSDIKQWSTQLIGQTIPNWSLAIKIAQKAHTEFPNIKTIGWDIAVTNNGIYLLEGNFNWGVANHQVGGYPLMHETNLEICDLKVG